MKYKETELIKTMELKKMTLREIMEFLQPMPADMLDQVGTLIVHCADGDGIMQPDEEE